MLRLLSSILAGLALAFVLVFAADALFHLMTPVSVRGGLGTREALRVFYASQPPGLLAVLLACWGLAVFMGAAVAACFARRGPWPGLVVAGLFLLGSAANFMLVPHPAWMVAVGLLVVIAAGWFGARMGPRPETLEAS